MIIKSKRVKARGQALKRVLRHITDGEDNDAVELIFGNVADLEDARNDALRFGREYAVRHWILAPGEPISKEQLAELVERLAAEFRFDTKLVGIWKHTKDRATDNNGCKEHYHLCAPEVDPLSGGVMSSSHDWRKHEKLARTVEVLWGHAIVPGQHTAAVVAALGRENGANVVAALRETAPLDHPQSFDETNHQRLKRAGYDLPCLRVMIADALSSSVSCAEFETKLAVLGLHLRAGDKMDTPIIETVDGGILIGSLARLTRLRKAALAERLKFDAGYVPKVQAHNSSSHLPHGEATRGATGASIEARGQRQQPGSAGPNGHDSELVAADSRWNRSGPRSAGESGSAPGRSGGGQDDQSCHARLKFAVGCIQHQDTLLDLLGEARRAALSPLERVTSDLDHVIERETRVHQMAGLPEPISLLVARRKASETTERLRALEKRASGIEQQLACHQPASIWQRLRRPAGDPSGTAALETRRDDVQRKILAAHSNSTSAAQALKAEEHKFGVACAQHESALSVRRVQADANIATAQAARKFLTKNPNAARWGAPYLMCVSADLQKARAEWRTAPDRDAPDDWSLIPILDLWGKPYMPPSV